MTALTVTPSETGLTRVFALEADAATARDLSAEGGAGLSTLLAAPPLDMAHVELFPAADLGPLTLTDYLRAGAGLDAAALAPDRERLDGIRSHVLLVHSRAFGGRPAELRPGPPLSWIGTYPLEGQSPAGPPLSSVGARGVLAGPPATGTAPRPGRLVLPIAAGLLVALMALVIFLIAR